ncbi:hypothetical protein MPER_11416, partial [Moniliophthora perniciosa FA553]
DIFDTINEEQRNAIYTVLDVALDSVQLRYLRYMILACPYGMIRGRFGDSAFADDLAVQSGAALSYATSGLPTTNDDLASQVGDNDSDDNDNEDAGDDGEDMDEDNASGDDDAEDEFEMP